jgi:hypothetical protein
MGSFFFFYSRRSMAADAACARGIARSRASIAPPNREYFRFNML